MIDEFAVEILALYLLDVVAFVPVAVFVVIVSFAVFAVVCSVSCL